MIFQWQDWTSSPKVRVQNEKRKIIGQISDPGWGLPKMVNEKMEISKVHTEYYHRLPTCSPV